MFDVCAEKKCFVFYINLTLDYMSDSIESVTFSVAIFQHIYIRLTIY